MKKDRNMFSLLNIEVSDQVIEEMFDLSESENMNEALINRYREAEKLTSPVNSKEIDDRYEELVMRLRRKLAMRGMKWESIGPCKKGEDINGEGPNKETDWIH